MPARIEDVAERCGLSVATVSRVINNGSNVSSSARTRVMQAVAELNYSPNALARGLVRRRTFQIGVVVPDISTSFASTILGSIERSAAQHGYNILLCNIMGDLDKECHYLDAFRQMRVDGLIIMHEKTDGQVGELLGALDMPIVACTVRLARATAKNCSTVVIDDYAAARTAVEYLLHAGHEKIAIFCDSLDEYSSGVLRSRGAEDAVRAYGYAPEQMLFRYGKLNYEDGYRQMRELLRQGELPTAVFVVSDDCAAGAMTAALDAGIRVPEELSVVGFDDAAIAVRVRPKLSTIRQPLDEIGRIAAEELIRRIEDPKLIPANITANHEFILRESSAPVRREG